MKKGLKYALVSLGGLILASVFVFGVMYALNPYFW